MLQVLWTTGGVSLLCVKCWTVTYCRVNMRQLLCTPHILVAALTTYSGMPEHGLFSQTTIQPPLSDHQAIILLACPSMCFLGKGVTSRGGHLGQHTGCSTGSPGTSSNDQSI